MRNQWMKSATLAKMVSSGLGVRWRFILYIKIFDWWLSMKNILRGRIAIGMDDYSQLNIPFTFIRKHITKYDYKNLLGVQFQATRQITPHNRLTWNTPGVPEMQLIAKMHKQLCSIIAHIAGVCPRFHWSPVRKQTKFGAVKWMLLLIHSNNFWKRCHITQFKINSFHEISWVSIKLI